MDGAKELFWADVDSGELHIRDKWQFALKSDFIPQSAKLQNLYTQEFYLFIPNSLMINGKTYPKEQFYLDQTSLIRYKTPEFSFADILNKEEPASPLTRVLSLCSQTPSAESREQLSDELKLLANVVRSTLRKETKRLIQLLQEARVISMASGEFIKDVRQLQRDILKLREGYDKAKKSFQANWNDSAFYPQILYIDEFVNDVITHYATAILENLRLTSHEHLLDADKTLCEIILEEKHLSESFSIDHDNGHPRTSQNGETTLYRSNLLSKFVLDALQLNTNRFSLDQRFEHWIGALSAGVAIMVYFSLFFWLGNIFVINSAPFLTVAAIFYILKDRIKDWLRALSYQKASRWFPDYTTIIRPLENTSHQLGVIKESFSFIDPKQLSLELTAIRNAEFHTVLESFQRPETVLYYKRIIEIQNPPKTSDPRRLGLNIIFRLNIQRFLHQASDPIETHLTIDPVSRKLVTVRLPKVYHLNLIIKSITSSPHHQPKVEYKKLRIVVDKSGIKRIETIY